MSSPSVVTHCTWEMNRIIITFIDKEVSISVSIKEARDLFSQLGTSIENYDALDKAVDEEFNKKGA